MLRRLVAEALRHFDHVILDTPANEVGVDALVAAARCRSALVLSRRNTNRMTDMRELVGALESAQVDITGVAINDY